MFEKNTINPLVFGIEIDCPNMVFPQHRFYGSVFFIKKTHQFLQFFCCWYFMFNPIEKLRAHQHQVDLKRRMGFVCVFFQDSFMPPQIKSDKKKTITHNINLCMEGYIATNLQGCRAAHLKHARGTNPRTFEFPRSYCICVCYILEQDPRRDRSASFGSIRCVCPSRAISASI